MKVLLKGCVPSACKCQKRCSDALPNLRDALNASACDGERFGVSLVEGRPCVVQL